jgi:hypothetical protein
MLFTSSCHSTKTITEPVVETNVQTEYKYIERIDTVTVTVTIPAETVTNKTTDTSSHLETSVAQSDAWIDDNGKLNHTLTNKAQDKKQDVPIVTTSEQSSAVETKYIKVPVEVEAKLTWWQNTQLNTWWYLAAIVIASIIGIGIKYRSKIANVFSLLINFARRLI